MVVALWAVAMILVLMLSAHPSRACAGAVLAGVLWAAPCFVHKSPLDRFLLMCLMGSPVAGATALAIVQPIAGLRSRLRYLLTLGDTRQLKRCRRSFKAGAFGQLVVATVVLAASIAAVKMASGTRAWVLVRWFGGGVGVLAFAEMVTAGLPFAAALLGTTVPALMRSPYRSASVAEFWASRWNIWAAQKVFHPYCYGPLARQSVALALFAAFALSGGGHLLLAFMALGRWDVAFMWGAFFFAQPVFILAERWMQIRHWRRPARHLWTLAALAITSPLFVEPALQIVEGNWGAPDQVLLPTSVAVPFVLLISAIFSGASLTSTSES